MMKQLRGLLFGKYVKQLFITSLVSCFILLGSSFVSAELTIVDYGSIGGLSSVSSDWNFSYDSYNFYNATSSSKSYSRIWWESDSFLHFNNRKYGSSSYLEGKITGFFVCPLMTGLGNTYLKNIEGCEYYFGFGSDFMNLIQNTDKWAYFYNSNSSNNRTVLCGINSLSNEMVCVDYSHYDVEGSSKLSDSDISAVSVSNPNRASSPTPGGNGGTTVNFINNKQATYNALYRKGYRSQLCYGGFDLDDLFGTGNSSFGDIKVSSGATVFELFDTYGSGSSFVSWYDNNYLDYLYLESFQDEYEYTRYFGKSRGLIGLGIVRKSYFRGNDIDFNAGDLRTFCSLYFSDEVDTEVSPIGQIDSMLGDDNVDGIIGDLGILIPSSGSALDMLFQQVFSGVCSGTVEECLMASGNVSDMVNTSWNTWSLRGLRGGIDGILPTYIVVGFFGILLLYYLRR